MKDFLKQLVQRSETALLARCLVREYLQARTLQVLQESLVFRNWCFLGGTALRFVYGMPRFSEDLDFSLTQAGAADNFRTALAAVKAAFDAENYEIDVGIKESKVVKSAFVRFKGLYFELNLSPYESETLAVKVEVDTDPPAGAGTATTMVRRYELLNLHHYDQASLLAGKLHAVLMRSYAKGRDIYDLVWYMSDRSWPAPNLLLLNNALQQTKWQGPKITMNNWKSEVAGAIEKMRWQAVINDVRPFLERPAEETLLARENVLSLLK